MSANEDYNLIYENWIPCLNKNGTITEYGIKDVLEKSDEIVDVVHKSPVVVGSIYRLLLAILQRNLDTTSMDEFERIWTDGFWDRELINTYLRKCEDRFNLFDKKRPFYQVPDFEEGSLKTINALGIELSSGHNTILFDHSFDDDEDFIYPSTAAKWIVACQSFSVLNGKSATGYHMFAPLVGKAIVLLKGQNLTESLALNLLQYDHSNPSRLLEYETTSAEKEDFPHWESSEEDEPGSSRYINGYLDYLTWQSRCIRLIPENDDGNLLVKKMYFSQGFGIKEIDSLREPMAAYINTKNGIKPVPIYRDKEPWRSYSALANIASDNHSVPKNVRNVAYLVLEGILEYKRRYQLDVIGISNYQSKIYQWRHVKMPLPAILLENNEVMARIVSAIEYAEGYGTILNKCVYRLARELLTKNKEDKPPKKLVSELADSIDINTEYWTSMEIPFYDYIEALAKETEPNELDKVLLYWAKEVARKKAYKALHTYLSSLIDKPRNIRASIKAKSTFDFESSLLLKKIEVGK